MSLSVSYVVEKRRALGNHSSSHHNHVSYVKIAHDKTDLLQHFVCLNFDMRVWHVRATFRAAPCVECPNKGGSLQKVGVCARSVLVKREHQGEWEG